MSLTIKDVQSVTTDFQVEKVDVSQWWGGSVFVRTLSGNRRAQLDELFNDKKKSRRGMRASIVSLSWGNEAGEFQDVSPGDVEALGDRSGDALDKLCDACIQLSGLTDVEAEVKN